MPTEVSQEGDAGIATRALRPGWATGSSSPGAPALGVLVGATVGSPDCSPLALTAGASPPPHLPQQRQHPLPGPQGGLPQSRAGAWTDAGSGDGPTARPGSQPAGASQLSCVTWGTGWLGGSGTSDAGIPRSPQGPAGVSCRHGPTTWGSGGHIRPLLHIFVFLPTLHKCANCSYSQARCASPPETLLERMCHVGPLGQ